MAVRLKGHTKRIERLIADGAVRKKELGEAGDKALKRRIGELRACPTEALLTAGNGKWHEVPHDWPGCLSGRLPGDDRIIVQRLDVNGEAVWLIREIGHAYKH